jgi:HIRAN domain
LSILHHIPVVAGLAYIERVRRLPSAFTATLVVEPDNRYFPYAIAVLANGEKVGYVAPEVATGYFEAVKAAAPGAVTCPARPGAFSDHATSGVELLLDFTALPVAPAE